MIFPTLKKWLAFIYCVRMCVCVCVHPPMPQDTWRSEDNLPDYVGYGYYTQAMRFGDKQISLALFF